MQVELNFVATPGPCAHELPAYLSSELKRRLNALENLSVHPGTLATNVKATSSSSNDTDDESRVDGGVTLTCMQQDLTSQQVLAATTTTSSSHTDYVVLAPTHIDPTVHGLVAPGLEIDPLNGGNVSFSFEIECYD